MLAYVPGSKYYCCCTFSRVQTIRLISLYDLIKLMRFPHIFWGQQNVFVFSSQVTVWRSVFNSNFQLCTPKYPSPPLTFSWCLCAPAPTVWVNKTPRFCHGGQGEGDAQPSHWLKVSCACHLRPKPRLKGAAVRPGPQRVMSISTPEPPPSTFFPLAVLCLLTCSAVCTKCFNMHF